MLEEERKQIDEIDRQLTALFEQRLAVSKKIATVKHQQKMSLTNPTRETEVIQAQTKNLSDQTLAPYLTDWYRSTILLSKQYQANVIKRLR
ncbi:chorismate mutase [Loigolactobacillus iwatensis]|uniref:chorismate mutase n=1 Tax=Loigolactobacillus iwatensis TaxID=1267156 RepID=UPI000F7F6E50|nr:chorismate mutase [Loigolactobacillus iwatensis]